MAKKETFPKIAAEGKIKTSTKKKGCVDLKFDGLNFSTGQYEQLSSWIDEETELRVTLEQVQGELL